MTQGFLAGLFALLLFTAASGFAWAGEVPVPEKPNSKLFASGKATYEKHCAICHGQTGAGDGKGAYLLFPKPRNFSSGEFRLISTSSMEVTDEDLFKTITRGMPGSSMPAWDHLSEKDRWALVYYVRYLTRLKSYEEKGEITKEMLAKGVPWKIAQKMVPSGIDPQNSITVPSEPAVIPEAVERGKQLFVQACASCHGATGKGDGPQVLNDSSGLPAKARDLTAGIFKGNSTSKDLYYRIIAGLPGSPMPGFNGAFTEEQIWDLVHYVQTLSDPTAQERTRVRFHALASTSMNGGISQDPLADQWMNASSVFIPLTPLWWRDDRVEGIEVRSLYDNEKIGIHVSWADPTKNAAQTAPQLFSDGVAIQFSGENDPPTFAMGSTEHPVILWHWKAVWSEDVTKGWTDIGSRYPNTAVDWYEAQKNYKHGDPFEFKDAKTADQDPKFMSGWGAGNPLSNPERRSQTEVGAARGIGTYTVPKMTFEKVDAASVWKDGRWHVLFTRSLKPREKGGIEFKPGKPVSLGFAVWDGEKQDRNGQKMVSVWNKLTLEK